MKQLMDRMKRFQRVGCGPHMIGPVSPEIQWVEAGEQEEGEEASQENDGDQGCEEVAHVRAMKSERAPSEQEIEEHVATHMPFKPWCPCCVAGKAVNS